ncbi:hypothetical protein BLL40_03510 [Domibacillus mangrovi]|uniref:Uncharacterized protein n=1 Tax=Domibacillus mangrovi TaxID=1714354 RepID=A0A1Q5P665_9BACI|nr:hypothetical protein BLL40_03510 [Domibacillus mangrovi]
MKCTIMEFLIDQKSKPGIKEKKLDMLFRKKFISAFAQRRKGNAFVKHRLRFPLVAGVFCHIFVD